MPSPAIGYSLRLLHTGIRASGVLATCFAVTTILGTSILLSGDATAETERRPGNYSERFEAPQRQVRLQDNNVWVYTRDFAERWGMPERWIDEDLRGAEAVAYRVERISLQHCGYFGEPGNCRPMEDCLLDVYLNEEQSGRLPWKSDQPQGFLHRSSSKLFLTAQREEDHGGWNPELGRWDMFHPRAGLDSLGWVSGPPRDGKVYAGSSDGVRVLAYDRHIYDGLAYLMLSTDCILPTQKRDVRIFFMERFPTPTDHGYRRVGKGLQASPEVAARFKEFNQQWFERHFSGDVPHVVHLPNRYMRRVNAYQNTQFRSSSLATEVERRMVGGVSFGSIIRNWWQRLIGLFQ